MSLIIVLLALLAERMAVFIHPWREHSWFERFSHKITIMARKNAYVGIFLSVIPLLGIIFLVHWGLGRVSYGWASWIFDLIVLIYCLGNTHLRLQLQECYEQIEQGNVENARTLLLDHFDIVESGEITAYVLMKAFYRASLQRVFSILFWFVVLGPVGAVLYRLIQKLSVYYVDDSMSQLQRLAEQLTFILDWVPARLLALSFCLVGQFTDIFGEWRDTFKKNIKETYEVLYSCGHVAIRTDDHPDSMMLLAQFDEAYYLVCRSLFIWLVVLALIIIF